MYKYIGCPIPLLLVFEECFLMRKNNFSVTFDDEVHFVLH